MKNFEISSFADTGDLNRERVVLKATEDIDIGRFILIRSKADAEGDPISGSKDAYWFPDKTVNRGDFVVVYTKSGTSSTKLMSSGSTAHFYYWHKKTPFWGPDEKNVAVLLEAPVWSSKKPSA